MTDYPTLVILRLGIVGMGAIVTLWGLRLAIRTPGHRRTYLPLTAGFALVTLGAVVEGVLFEFLGWSLSAAHTAEAFIGAFGFALILASIQRSPV